MPSVEDQGVVTPIGAVVTAATGVKKRSRDQGLFLVSVMWEYGLALALVTWPNIIIQRAVNWGIQLYEQLKTN